MYNCSAAPSRSLDLASTETTNAGRYQSPNVRVRLASCNGLPIAFRRAVVMNEGSLATRRIQAVTAGGVTELSATEAERLLAKTIPLN